MPPRPRANAAVTPAAKEPAAASSADASGPRRDVTVKALAAAVGLSQPAVSQVLNGTGRISAETRERVFKVAEQMGYRPNAAARAIVTRKTKQVGVLVVNNPADPETYPQAYYTILGMNMALEPAGYVLCLVRIGDVEQELAGHSRVFREHVLDGVIVTTNLPDRVANAIRKLVPHVIWADTNQWYDTRCVRRDEYAVGVRAAEAVAAAGYRRAIFLTEEDDAGGLPPHYSYIERFRGVSTVCRRARIPVETVQQRWDWTPEFAARLAPMLKPDVAVVVSDSLRARIVQQTAAVNRLMIGHDFGLVSCDSSGDVLSTWPGLCGLPFDRIDLGRHAALMMLSILDASDESPRSLLLPSGYHKGDTLKQGR